MLKDGNLEQKFYRMSTFIITVGSILLAFFRCSTDELLQDRSIHVHIKIITRNFHLKLFESLNAFRVHAGREICYVLY
jgi:hypothetical protein